MFIRLTPASRTKLSEWSYSELEHVLQQPKVSEEAGIVEDDSDEGAPLPEAEEDAEQAVVGRKRKIKKKHGKNKRARRA